MFKFDLLKSFERFALILYASFAAIFSIKSTYNCSKEPIRPTKRYSVLLQRYAAGIVKNCVIRIKSKCIQIWIAIALRCFCVHGSSILEHIITLNVVEWPSF